MKVQFFRVGGLILGTLALLTACAKPPAYQQPISATPPTGRVIPAHAVNLLDSSGSNTMSFASGKATLESIVGVMPSGKYAAGNINFGGFKRESTGQSPFNRGMLANAAKNASYLGGSTPIFEVIGDDLSNAIGGTSGRAAVILISDGRSTDYVGRDGMDDQTVEAARAVANGRPGETCFHTIQIGNDAAGAALLNSLANVSKCGSFRHESTLKSAGALQKFSREVYLGAAPPPRPTPTAKSKAMDSDQDGVVDSADACPKTLRNARVDARGCWTLSGVRFAVNSADLTGGSTAATLEDALAVLRANPKVRVSIDGHTDSDGSEAYNSSLSKRRASSVLNYFVKTGGLDANRFEVNGYGESSPIAPNNNAENKRMNRRVELTVVD